MVFQETFEVLLTIFTEQECIYLRPELLEGKVVGSEEGTSNVSGGIVDGFDQSSLGEAKLKGAEFARD